MAEDKKARRPKKRVMEETDVTESSTPMWGAHEVKATMNTESPKKKAINFKLVGIILVVLVVVAGWWWQTKTWPIVAMVGLRPITRYEVNQTLFKQYGKGLVESLITQRAVEDELAKLGIKADEKEIDAKIEEAKKGLPQGQKLEDELAKQGMTVALLRKYIGLQLMVNKAVEGKATVSAEEVEKYLKENGTYLPGSSSAEKKSQAENYLKRSKSDTEIGKWVDEVMAKARVYRFF